MEKTDSFSHTGVKVTDVVTDRSPSVRTMLTTDFPHLTRHYDCWHITRSFSKKVGQISKKKCESVLIIKRTANFSKVFQQLFSLQPTQLSSHG